MNNKDMSRELIVTLLQRQIDELMLMTEGFMDMESYPEAIIQLAQLKNDDIREYLDMLAKLPKATAKIAGKTEPDIIAGKTESNIIAEPSSLIVIPKTDDTDEIDPEELEDNLPTAEEPDEDEKSNADVETEEVIDNPADVNIDEEVEEIDQKDIIIEEEEEEEEDDDDEEEEDEDEEGEDEEGDNHNVEEEKIEEEEVFILEFEEDKAEPEVTTPETPKTTLAEKLAASSMTRNEAHNRAENSILSSINNTRITDIRQAISIGDRFRFQRELFRGNGEDMNKTLNYINQLATLHEVESFLNSKYNWPADNPAVEDFFQIIKRKF